MNDTPQTDNLARGNHVVPTEFAQELEVERNHAQEGLTRAGLIIAQIQKDADEIERERDKVKAEVARLQTGLLHIINDAPWLTGRTMEHRLRALASVCDGKEETK
jgi:hypothetical protein